MSRAPRSAGLITRALLLVGLTGLAAAGAFGLMLRPGEAGLAGWPGWMASWEGRVGLAAMSVLALGGLGGVLLFAGPDRAVGEALIGLAELPGEAGTEPDQSPRAVADLVDRAAEWRRRVRIAEATQERLDAAVKRLAKRLADAAGDPAGASAGSASVTALEDPEDELLRELAAAAQGLLGTSSRLRTQVSGLLEKVSEDLNAAAEPLGNIEAMITNMGLVLDDLAATQPQIRALAALRAALEDCRLEAAAARYGWELVDRELAAVRCRMGGRVDRLTAGDLLSPEVELPGPGADE